MNNFSQLLRANPAANKSIPHRSCPQTQERGAPALRERCSFARNWSSALLAALLLTTTPALAARGPKVGPGTPSAVELAGNETPEQIQQAYAKTITTLALNLANQDGEALKSFEATLHNAARPGAEVERAACGKAIALALNGNAPAEAKAWMLKLAAFAGQPELVPAATRLLNEPEPLLRESARYALQKNPAPEAAEALRAALDKTTEPAWQGALVLALGARKDAASVPTLAKLLTLKDEAAVTAALDALAEIATPAALEILLKARDSVPASLRIVAAQACLKCAGARFAQGDAPATGLFRELSQPTQPRPVRLAALVGSLKVAGKDAGDRVFEMLAGNDADARAVALGYLPDLPSPASANLAARMGQLPAEVQMLVLSALAEMGEKAALPVAMEFTRRADEGSRTAGLNALARLGDASTVPLLVTAMQPGNPTASAARETLLKLGGSGVNEAVASAMQTQANTGVRTDLIVILETRGASEAVPALLKEVASDNPAVRRAAMHALGKLAGTKEAPSMLAALVKLPAGAERDDAERAIASACGREADAEKQSAPILAAYAKANAAERALLVPLLGRMGGSKAFEVVKAALAGNDPALAKAGETALANWPDADDAVETELLGMAQRAQKPNDRASALRAYVRVIALPSGLPEKTRLAKFRKALELADRDAEKNLVLDRVADLKHIEALRFLVPFLDQPALANRAGTAIVRLAGEKSLMPRYRADFEPVLNKIAAVSTDKGLVSRAKKALNGK